MTETRVRLAGTPEDEAACFAIRRAVFVLGQGVPASLESDGLDPRCTHFLAERRAAAGWEPLGTARLRVTPEGLAKAERVAVLAEARGLGLGLALMVALEEAAREAGHGEVVLNAQASVVDFYSKMGYRSVGPRFLEADIEHQKMKKPLR